MRRYSRLLFPLTVILATAITALTLFPSSVDARPPRLPIPPGVTGLMLEGKVEAIDAGAGTITVMGVTFGVPANIRISTPVRNVTLAELLGAPLPGRTLPGLLGGVAVVQGVMVGGAPVATAIDIQPQENVLNGPATGVVGGTFTVLGRPVVLNTDPRMLGRAENEEALPVNLALAPIGSDSAVDGYQGDDGVFYAWRIANNAAPVAGGPRVSIAKATCARNGALDIRGGSTSLTGSVTIFDANSGRRLGTARLVNVLGLYGRYRFSLARTTTCPTQVRVVAPDGSAVTADVAAP